jgi:AraC family transcriptional regulator, carnitine catabolism transcriptional activator
MTWLEQPRMLRHPPNMVHVSFVLFPGFPMLAYALGCAVLDIANRLSPEPLFTYDMRVPGHQPVYACNTALLEPGCPNWDAAETVDLVLVLCGDTLPARIPNGFQAFLSRIEAAGGRLGGVATGTLILAQIGWLNGRQAVISRSPDAADDRQFPAVEVLDRPYALDDRRLTVAGGTAIGEALCAWVAKSASPALAQEVARRLASGKLATPQNPTAAPDDTPEAAAPIDPIIAEMEARMRAHLEMPLALTDLAESLGMSRKALRGRCERALGVRPSDHYLTLRLRHGADLLRHTAMPVSEIARASGFETLAGFSRAISNKLGVSPSAVRKMARAARMVTAYA